MKNPDQTKMNEIERQAEEEKPLFELFGPNGERWSIYENGTYTGFPDGTWIANRASSRINLLLGRIEELKAAMIADQK